LIAQHAINQIWFCEYSPHRQQSRTNGKIEKEQHMAMFTSDLLDLAFWAALIEFVGALLIISYLLLALWPLLRTREVQSTCLQAATGVVTGLSFKLAATLLKTIQLQTWQQILVFTAIFALRTVLKRVLTWEQMRFQ
jgi:uncharacterized membrane protein